ncbi:MAG: ROK family protein, partial [Clostridia bacterium]|nr:ROK family protein [Clostridia bacterium]
MMYYMGFDIGGTKCAVVIGDEAGNILAKTKIATTKVNETLEQIFAIAENYAAEYHPVSVGISCGGPLDKLYALFLGERAVTFRPRVLVSADDYRVFVLPQVKTAAIFGQSV